MGSAEPKIVAKPIARNRRWGLRLLILIGLLVVGEFYARGQAWSAPRYSSFLRYQHVFTPALQQAYDSQGNVFWMTHDPRHPVQWIARDKAPETLRVICFGGSATAGLGHSPNVTFPRHLEILLRRAYPERPIEVLNLGTVAIGSKQVLQLVRDAIAYAEPDLMIVYSGNNEFLEVHAKEFARTRGGWKAQLASTLRQSALVRALERAVQGEAEPTDLPDRRPGQSGHTQAEIIEEIEIDASAERAALSAYVQNLVAAAQAAQEAEVPTVICTVAVNWLWSGKEVRESAGQDAADAEQRLAELDRVDLDSLPDRKARWRHVLERADALAVLQRDDEAAQAYLQALEIDPHQRRATVSQGEALQGGLLATKARIFNSTQWYLSRAQRPWIGFDEFYDYVHFTPYGAALLAEGLFTDLAQAGWLPGAEEGVAEGYAAAHRAEVLARASQADAPDFFERDRFLGIGLDPANLTSRNLWKYEAMALELDRVLAEDPDHVAASIYRGNRRSFQRGQRDRALADWRRALSAGGPEERLRTAIEALQNRPRLNRSLFDLR